MSSDSSSDSDDVFARALARHRPSTLSASTKPASTAKPDSRASVAQKKAVPSFGSVPAANGGDGKGKETSVGKPIAALFGPVPDLPPPASAPAPAPAPALVSAPTAAATAASASTSSQSRATRVFSAPKQAPLPPPKVPYPANTTPLPVPSSNPFVAHAAGAGAGPVSWLEQAPHAPELSLFSPQAVAITAAAAQHAALFSEHIQQKSTPEAKVGPGSGVRGIVREFGHVHTVAPVSDGEGVWVVPVGPLLPPPVHHTNATTTTTTSSSSNSNTTAKFKTPTMSHLKITAADAKPLLASHSNVSRAKANATHSFVGVGVDVPPPQAPAGFFSNKDSFLSGVVLAPPTLPAVPLPTIPPAPPMAPGRLGHPVRLVANVGKVEFSPTAAFGVFDVAFEPPISVAAHRCDVFSAAIATSPLASSLSLCFDGSKQAFSPAPLTSFCAPWPLRARVLPPYLVAAARDVPEDEFLDECGVSVTVTPQSEPIPLSLLVTYAKQARAWAAGGDVEVRPPQLPSHVLRAVNALVRSTLVANSGAEVGVLGTLLQALSRSHGGKGSMGSLLLSPPLLLPRLHNALPLPSSGGAVARSALYLASRLTQAGLVVSADVRTFATTAPLPLTRLVELMAEADAAPGYLVGSKGETASLPQPQYRLSKRLQGLRVVTTHRSVRTYTITGVAPPADCVTLSVGSRKITLTEFFRSKFHVILPNSSTLPCVKAGDHITLPLAVCSVLPDQCAGGQFPQKAKMTLREGSCLPAADRKKIVAASLALASSSSSSSIRISPSLLSVQARVLPPFPVFTAPHTGEVRALPPRVAKEWKAKADERLAYAPPTIGGGGGEEKEGETKRKKRLRGGVLSSDDAVALEVAAAAEETAAVIKAKDEAAAAAAAFTTPGTVHQSEPVLVRPFSGPAAASSTTGVPVCCDPSPPQGPPALLSFSSGTRREPFFLPAEGTSGAALPLHDVSTPHTCLPPSGAAVCTQTVPVLGAWTTRARRLIDPRHVDAPLVLNAAMGQGAGSTDDVYSFFGTLMSTAADMGLSIAPLRAVFPAMNPIVAEQRLARAFSDPSTRPDVVFVVTSSPSQCPVYAAVKHLCLVKYGCVSQGISGAKLASRSTWAHGYFANLTLKLNAKLGGLAFACPPPAALTNTPTLVLGCDADHPTRALRSTGGAAGDAEYSFSAVVGSRDLAATRFAGVLQQQGIEQELLPLPHMAHAVRRHVAEFTRSTGRIPARIVMFRDGVADSQRRAVAVQEVAAIKAACQGIESGYEPEVVFVLCVKRHTVRFWPDDSKDAVTSIAEHNAAANMPPGTYTTHPVMHAPVPGTVVDDPSIARADGNEFYLLSHHAHRGTPHPVCYQVVVNEAKLSADEVQELAYYLCHGAQRVAKTSNVPAVALHAHLMCRGGKYLSKKYEPRALVDAAARGVSIDAPYAPPTGGANKGPEVWEGYVHPDLWELPFYM